jgi:predicted nucleic acid-binding protein
LLYTYQTLIFTFILTLPKIIPNENTAIHDFEDGIEYYSALESKCNCIITEDVKDFYFSEIEVLTCHDFFKTYMANP